MLATAGSAGAVLLAGGTANASTGRLTQQVTCAGQLLTIYSAPGNDGNNWGSAQVQGGGHLVLATLEYSLHDDTAGVWLDDEVLSHGKAHTQQQAIGCDVARQQFVLGDVAPPDFAYPPATGPGRTRSPAQCAPRWCRVPDGQGGPRPPCAAGRPRQMPRPIRPDEARWSAGSVLCS